MKTIISYKELLESFLKQIKESEVTNERVIGLAEYIQNEIEMIDYDGNDLQQFDNPDLELWYDKTILDKETWKNTFYSLHNSR